jgi:oxidase EvaA
MIKKIENLHNGLLSILREESKKSKLNLELKVDFFLSSLASVPSLHTMKEVELWFRERRKNSKLKTRIIPVRKTKGWIQEEKTGNIRHITGKFFSVVGIYTISKTREVKSWYQPIIKQPEIGILGFLVKKINGIYHFLVQAKEEPGNIGKVQLSTTLMATQSNFTQVHQGKCPLYLDYFLEQKKGKVLVKKLQSEEGARFYRKNNLNMIVEIPGSAEEKVPKEFMWITLYQIKVMMQKENVVNSAARSVIACLP